MHEHFRLMMLQILSAPIPVSPADQSGANGGLLLLIASFISQVKVNGVVAVLIQGMKKGQTPILQWISINTPWVTRTVAAVFAAATAIGIHWTFTPASATSSGTLLISGLSATAIVMFIYNIVQNYMFQHAWFKTMFGSPDVTVAKD